MRERGFVTAGTWCLDRNRRIDAWPREDSVGVAWGLEERGGGSACNLGIGVRRLDPSVPVATIGLVGDDAGGRTLIAEAEAAGIDATRLRVTPAAPTHTTEAFISEASGLRTHISDLGASALLSPEDLDVADVPGRFLHLGLPGVHPRLDGRWGEDANGWVTVLRAARAAGLETNLELCTVPPDRLGALIHPCLPWLDTLIVNDAEIGALAGMATVGNVAACEAAARAVLARGPMRLVAVHFPQAAVAVTREGAAVAVPSVAVPETEIAGPNGAGDAFAAGFLYGQHEGWGIADSLWLGHAAAACSLRAAGTTDGLTGWRESLALAERWGRRS